MFGVLIMLMNISSYQSIHTAGHRIERQRGNRRIASSGVEGAGRPPRFHALLKWTILTAFFVLLFTGWLIVTTNASQSPSPVPGAGERLVIVASGETLWSIALQAKPREMDTREAIYKIERRNVLHDSAIKAGQSIIIPDFK